MKNRYKFLVFLVSLLCFTTFVQAQTKEKAKSKSTIKVVDKPKIKDSIPTLVKVKDSIKPIAKTKVKDTLQPLTKSKVKDSVANTIKPKTKNSIKSMEKARQKDSILAIDNKKLQDTLKKIEKSKPIIPEIAEDKSIESIQSEDTISYTDSKGLFEGIVTYQLRELNPNKGIISDAEYDKTVSNSRTTIMKMYIRSNQFKKVYEDHIEIYDPKKGMLYVNYPLTDDSSQYLPAGVAEEPVIKVANGTNTEQVYGKTCNEVIVSTKWDKTYYYYNPETLKTNKAFWGRYLIENMGPFLSKIGCFPLLVIKESMLGNLEQLVIKIEPKKLENKDFIPK